MTLNDVLIMREVVVVLSRVGNLKVLYKPPAPLIYCHDGTTLSVQAGEHVNYCLPKTNEGLWSKVEVGFPSRSFPELEEYKDGDDDQTDSVFGYVPVEVVESVIAQCGGICEEWTILKARI